MNPQEKFSFAHILEVIVEAISCYSKEDTWRAAWLLGLTSNLTVSLNHKHYGFYKETDSDKELVDFFEKRLSESSEKDILAPYTRKDLSRLERKCRIMRDGLLKEYWQTKQ